MIKKAGLICPAGGEAGRPVLLNASLTVHVMTMQSLMLPCNAEAEHIHWVSVGAQDESVSAISKQVA